MANLSVCIRTLENVLDSYELAAAARERLEDVLGELRAPPPPGPWHLDAGQVKTAEGIVVASVPWGSDGPEDHAHYLNSWIAVLKADNRSIFTAASQAQKAADYLVGLQPS